MPDMRQERGAEHQLAEAAPAEGAQAAVAGQRRQRHDHGDPEVDRVAPDQPRREPQPFPEAGQGVRRRAQLLICCSFVVLFDLIYTG